MFFLVSLLPFQPTRVISFFLPFWSFLCTPCATPQPLHSCFQDPHSRFDSFYSIYHGGMMLFFNFSLSFITISWHCHICLFLHIWCAPRATPWPLSPQLCLGSKVLKKCFKMPPSSALKLNSFKSYSRYKAGLLENLEDFTTIHTNSGRSQFAPILTIPRPVLPQHMFQNVYHLKLSECTKRSPIWGS